QAAIQHMNARNVVIPQARVERQLRRCFPGILDVAGPQTHAEVDLRVSWILRGECGWQAKQGRSQRVSCLVCVYVAGRRIAERELLKKVPLQPVLIEIIDPGLQRVTPLDPRDAAAAI